MSARVLTHIYVANWPPVEIQFRFERFVFLSRILASIFRILASKLNSVGSYTCKCNEGYEGDGFYCTDLDECSILGSKILAFKR